MTERSISLDTPLNNAPTGICDCCDLPIDDCEWGGRGIELDPTHFKNHRISAADNGDYLAVKDLSKHTIACLKRSWTDYGCSPLTKHVCVCDQRGEPPEWDDLDRERRLVGKQEVEERLATVEERTAARVARNQATYEQEQAKAAEADGNGVTTLADLAAVFSDDVDLTPTPALLERRHGDGGMVLPAGKLNWIYGLPGSGKSFIGLIVLHESLLRGGRAIYLDYEDSAKTFQQRAAIIGLNPKDFADSFLYIHGGLSDYPAAQAEALEWLADADDADMNCIVIDAAESSGCPSDGAQVNDWLEKVVMPFRAPERDYGVQVLDHIPKSRERADGPIGSQRKLAAVDGISLLLGGYCWSKTKGGRITLTNDKDRTGSYGRKQAVATIIGDWEGHGDARTFAYRIAEPSKEDTANDNIGGAILEAVNGAGPAGFVGKNQLLKAVGGGNRNAVFSTIDSLVDGLLMTVGKRGQSEIFTLTEAGRAYLD